MTSLISEAWRKAEEIKREKERLLKKAHMKATTPRGGDKENSLSNIDFECNDPELRSIVDAAWQSQRDKVFKKKRHSITSKKDDVTPQLSARPHHHQELENIDELEESIKMDELENSPLKEVLLNGRAGQVKIQIEHLNKENLRKSVMQADFFTSLHQMEDGSSSHMHSMANSPSRKARRTREERRKTCNGRVETNESMCDDYSTNPHEEESMLNFSPLKKDKINHHIPRLALQTPSRDDIDDFLMQESLIATANKNHIEERIQTDGDAIYLHH